MHEDVFLNNQFLLAMPNMADPLFNGSVTYVCQHNDAGALGITVNRYGTMTIGEVLEQMKIPCPDEDLAARKVLRGGPVNPDRGFVLHRGGPDWNASFQVTDEITLTTSKDILEAMAQGEGPADALLALGYAGWAAGQLDQEMLENAWINTDADLDILFNCPMDDRWRRAASQIGIELKNLTGLSGHA